MQGHIWDQVAQEDADLEQRHSSVVQGVKLFHRQMKPSAVQPIHPIVCEQKAQKPHEQYAVVDDCTPEQDITYYYNTHTPSPTSLYLYVRGSLPDYAILPTGGTSMLAKATGYGHAL